MTLFRLALFTVSLFCIAVPFGTVEVKAGCVRPNSSAARAMIKTHHLKSFGQVIGRVPGKARKVELCGSGGSAHYKVRYQARGKSGLKMSTIRIPAR